MVCRDPLGLSGDRRPDRRAVAGHPRRRTAGGAPVTDVVSVLAWSTALVLFVVVGLAVGWWREVHRNDGLAAELDQARLDLANAHRETSAARYQNGRLERRLARMERDDATKVRYGRAGYVDMPTINGKRVV